MRLFSAVLLVATLFVAGCGRSSDLPALGTEQYKKLCSAFYLGLAALQSGEDVNARKGLKAATEIAPGEPAGWADLGLLQFRQQDYEGAFASVQRARALAPDNSRMEGLLGVIESRRGQPGETLVHLKKAVALDSGNLKALYSLAQETERESTGSSDKDSEDLLLQILQRQPNNLAVLVDVVRLAAKQNDTAGLRKAIAGLKSSAPMWPEAAKQQLAILERDASASNVRPAAIQAQFLRNVLVRVPAYRQSLDEVKTPVTSAGEPFLKFLRLPSPRSTPDAPDMKLRLERKQMAGLPLGQVSWIGTYVPDEKQSEQIIWADGKSLHVGGGASVPLPVGRSGNTKLGVHSILPADLNYDFKTDLVVASGSGLRIYEQQDPQHFRDVTAQSKLPSSILEGSYHGAWAFDVDLDGDLDVVLGSDSGEPLVLRNNGDGSFAPIHPFKAVNGLRAFASADVDGDGDPDVAMLDREGTLKVFANERLGDYRLRDTPSSVNASGVELAAADVNGDGLPDFVILKETGQVMRLSDLNSGKAWTTGELVAAPQGGARSMESSLALADLDNNGALDLVAGGQVYLSDGRSFVHLSGSAPLVLGGFLSTPARSTLEMVGWNPDRTPVAIALNSEKHYGFQQVRPQAATTHGDQRINSFGIGGEIQLRSDLLTQLQIISSPILHFGLGSHPGAEFARIVWPNGLIQTEFSLKADQVLNAEQRLKGSCPLLFAWNGSQMHYVKDVAPMSGALGAHDETGRIASVDQTEEWFKVSGEELKPKDGALDLRITDEYWESYYIDRYSLRAIDHPRGTNVFVDERVAVPPAPLRVYTVGSLHPFARAIDESGQDVSKSVRDLDRCYLSTFALGRYQGIAHDHWVELTVPADAPRHSSLYLIASGWLHPWDDGLLVAANQGRQDKLADLSVEVMNRDGRWITARKGLGVPAGREKTIVLELTHLFEPASQRRVRLRTNLEIYWDRLAWAPGFAESDSNDRQLELESAVLGYRGYSQTRQDGPRTPETPIYQLIAESGSKWQPIPGYYTRYGDVLPLLQKSDDRFVIQGSGDELRLRFAAGPPVEPGFVRDYVLAGDGWLKEGDYSFKHSNTLLPLPDHATREYNRPVTNLEQDVVYRRHQADWREYHTRYIPPEILASQLWK